MLVTGGLGFIGSNFVNRQIGAYNITVLDKVDECSNLKNVDMDQITFVKGDICDVDLVNLILVTYNIDTIVHFAAETHVDKSFGNSLRFTNSNILGTHTLLECARHYGKLKLFLHISTDEVYGSSDCKSREDDKHEPTNPYAATKAAAELLVKSYHISFGLPIVITRSNNVFGPQQYPEKLIPKIIMRLSNNETCEIHGDGSNKRSYLHVDDVCNALDIIITRGEIGKTYNIGSNIEYTNLEIWRLLIQSFRKKGYLTKDDDSYLKFVPDRAFNDKRYRIDSSEIEKLGWKQSDIPFEERLDEVVKWYLERPKYWN